LTISIGDVSFWHRQLDSFPQGEAKGYAESEDPRQARPQHRLSPSVRRSSAAAD
jgi:hypothetical protein